MSASAAGSPGGTATPVAPAAAAVSSYFLREAALYLPAILRRLQRRERDPLDSGWRIVERGERAIPGSINSSAYLWGIRAKPVPHQHPAAARRRHGARHDVDHGSGQGCDLTVGWV